MGEQNEHNKDCIPPVYFTDYTKEARSWMGAKDQETKSFQLSVNETLAEMKKASEEWRLANDAAFAQFLTMFSQENESSKNKLEVIEKTLASNVLDIDYVNKLKEKANWGWNTAKFIATLSTWLTGLYIGYHFLKEAIVNYFKH